MMFRTSFRFALAGSGIAAFLGILAIVAPGAAQEAKTVVPAASALDALPGDTTFFIQVRNVSDLTRKFKASPLHRLKDHPDLKALFSDFDKMLDEGLSDAKGQLGFDPRDILGMVEGEAVLAVGGLDRIVAALTAEFSGGEAEVNPGDLPIALIVDAGASAQKLQGCMEKLFAFAEKEGAKKTVESFQGGKIVTLADPKTGKAEKDDSGNERSEGGDLEKVYFGEMGSRFLVSVSRPYLEKTLSSLKAPGADALAKGADFQTTQKQTGAGSDMTVFINFRPIASAARRNLQANPMAAMVWNIVEGKVLGRGLRNMGFSLNLRENDIQQLLFINNGGLTDGIFGLFRGAAFSGRPSPLIPEDVDGFNSMSFNVPALYALIKEIYAMVAPIFLGMGMGGPGGPGGGAPPAQNFDLDQMLEGMYQIKMKEVMDSLGSLIHLYQKGGASPQNPIGNMVFALEVKDENPVRDALGKLLGMARIKPQKFQERDLYPLMPGFGGEGDDSGPALALADKYLLIGTTGGLVKEAIQRAAKGGKNIADTMGFKNLAGLLPSQVNSVSYASPRSFLESMKAVKQALESMGEGGIPDLTALGDLLDGSIGYGIWRDQGFYGESILVFKKDAGAGKTRAEKN